MDLKAPPRHPAEWQARGYALGLLSTAGISRQDRVELADGFWRWRTDALPTADYADAFRRYANLIIEWKHAEFERGPDGRWGRARGYALARVAIAASNIVRLARDELADGFADWHCSTRVDRRLSHRESFDRYVAAIREWVTATAQRDRIEFVREGQVVGTISPGQWGWEVGSLPITHNSPASEVALLRAQRDSLAGEKRQLVETLNGRDREMARLRAQLRTSRNHVSELCDALGKVRQYIPPQEFVQERYLS